MFQLLIQYISRVLILLSLQFLPRRNITKGNQKRLCINFYNHTSTSRDHQWWSSFNFFKGKAPLPRRYYQNIYFELAFQPSILYIATWCPPCCHRRTCLLDSSSPLWQQWGTQKLYFSLCEWTAPLYLCSLWVLEFHHCYSTPFSFTNISCFMLRSFPRTICWHEHDNVASVFGNKELEACIILSTGESVIVPNKKIIKVFLDFITRCAFWPIPSFLSRLMWTHQPSLIL